MLVVERADRLLRDLIVSEMAVWAFADVGVSIVTADTGENITEAGNDPLRKLIRQVLNAVADYERSALVAKLRAARDRKKRNGGHASGATVLASIPRRQKKPGRSPGSPSCAGLRQDASGSRCGRWLRRWLHRYSFSPHLA
ncbi:MAG: recombinase family protein [Planctomycetota bacterium]